MMKKDGEREKHLALELEEKVGEKKGILER